MIRVSTFCMQPEEAAQLTSALVGKTIVGIEYPPEFQYRGGTVLVLNNGERVMFTAEGWEADGITIQVNV